MTTAHTPWFDRNDYLKVYQHFATTAVELFNKEGSVHPQLFLVALSKTARSGVSQAVPLPPDLVQRLHNSEQGKNLMGAIIQNVVELAAQDKPLGPDDFRPHAVVHVAESWMSTAAQGELPARPLSQDPNRKEVIMVSVHSPLGSLVGINPVQPEPGRVASYADPMGMDEDASEHLEGRLVARAPVVKQTRH